MSSVLWKIPDLQCAALLAICCLFMTGCAGNDAFRTDAPAPCPGVNCDNSSFLQDHTHHGFDLAFVEFTERGNVFDRARMQTVLDKIEGYARSDQGVTAVVFVHGWKNNAHADNSNVFSFRELLKKTAALRARQDRRRLVGIYVGWRGMSLDAGLLTNLSYWERKEVAQQVGKGGVSELLLRLEHMLRDDDPNKNIYLVTGHSFGGAIVLSSLNEILLERVADARSMDDGTVLTRPFGHGIALVNPAIEANEILQLKELISERRFHRHQPKLMHVISSKADRATDRLFYLGQLLGTGLTWKQKTLRRTFGEDDARFEELDLDTTTVGNFLPFQTGYLTAAEKNPARQDDMPDDPYYDGPKHCVTKAQDNSWDYVSYVWHKKPGDRDECIVPEEDAEGHVPAGPFEPLSFIRTDAAFSSGHNDVFNDNVAAYLAAIQSEGQYKLALETDREPPRQGPKECRPIKGKTFDFGACFQAYHRMFCSTIITNPPNATCARSNEPQE